MSNTMMPDERALLERAHMLEISGREEEAYGVIQRLLRTNPSNAEANRASDRLKLAMPFKEKVESELMTAQDSHALMRNEPHPINMQAQQLRRQNEVLMQQMTQQAKISQPVVQITNQNVVQAAQVVQSAPRPTEARNDAAFAIGIIAGFFGLLGLAHLFNGKVGSGLALIFLGSPIYFMLMIAIASTGIGAFFVIPAHLYIIYQSAKSGASRLH